jgi:signal transduction histidine kinase
LHVSSARLARLISLCRWVIPLVLGASGFGYVYWEAVLDDGYSVHSPPVIIGWVLLGLAGPLLTFSTLTWAQRTAIAVACTEQASERQQKQLLALNSIGHAVNQSLELNQILDCAMDQILTVLQIESGELRLIEDGHLALRVSRGVSPAFIAAEPTIPLGECVCGACAQTGSLIAVEDIGQHPDLACRPCAREAFRSILSVPVRTTERVVGIIHVASRQPRIFDSADRALLSAIGHHVGAAIEKAQLHARLRAMNQELEERVAARTRELVAAKEELANKADALQQVLAEEHRIEERTRARIAHDLHDGVQQIIIGALFQTQAARDAMTEHPETSLARLEDAQQLLCQIEAEMRRAIYSLRPFALDAQGLVPALRECVASFARVSQVTYELVVEGSPRRLNPDAEAAVFRIVQEAMNNIDTHAGAKHADIRVQFGPEDLYVEIKDNGSGFDMAEVMRLPRTHLGLIGMKERAVSVGGTLRIASRMGEGTRVQLTVPIAR